MPDAQDIYKRTRAFAVRVIALCRYLQQQGGIARTLHTQLLRSGSSIGANLREGKAAESRADFIHKFQIALKEARETEYWCEIIEEAELVPVARLKPLRAELDEITRILVATIKTCKSRKSVESS